MINVCIEDLLSKGSVKYYAKPEDEITIYRSVMIRKENAEALNKITQETGISLTRLVNIAMKEFLDKYNKSYGKINIVPVSIIFDDQAVLHSNDVAVICDDKFLTYKELNERANSLAHYLISKGVKPNDIIAIMTNRSLETIVCMLGILKAESAFLNIMYGKAYIAVILTRITTQAIMLPIQVISINL